MAVYTGAVGFGANWDFDPDYEVRIVSTLAADGAGSLKYAVETSSVKTSILVVFNGLSGVITLDEEIYIPGGKQVYIAGQTSSNGIWIRMASNVEDAVFKNSGSPLGFILRHVVCALGATQVSAESTQNGGDYGLPGSGNGSGNVGGDNFTLLGGKNYVVDNCLLLWSTDESINFYGAKDITFQNCIVAEALMFATHAYTTDSSSAGYYGPHSMGLLSGNGTTRFTFYNMAFISNNQRNPIIGQDGTTITDMEMVNTLVYNFGDYATAVNHDNAEANLNFINVLYRYGPNSRTNRKPILLQSGSAALMDVYIDHCYDTIYRTSDSVDQWAITATNGVFTDTSDATQVSQPHVFPLRDEPRLNQTEILNTVLANAGTRFNFFHETRIKNYVRSGQGALINDPSDVGGHPTIDPGTPTVDSNNNGIPDSEEATWGTDTFGYVNSLIEAAPPTTTPGAGSNEAAIFAVIN